MLGGLKAYQDFVLCMGQVGRCNRMDILQLVSNNLSAFSSNPLVSQIILGATQGIVVGLVVGAVVWAIMEAPDTLGRALLFAIILGIIVSIWEFVRIGNVVGAGMGDIITTLNHNPQIGPLFLTAVLHTLTAMFIGAILGVGTQVPHFMIRGAIIGLFLGAFVGAVLQVALSHYGISLNRLIYRGVIALGIWALLTAVGGK